ncbi:hypothetical protein SEA_BILLNYE_37 [Streptomyces phage BillNye]|uniref:Uncharacterized protein n=2 Tax=Wilnyevirus billnye TaxID=2560486 RepID=A0A2L1IVM2_9CAUD|nr:hypothetical protein FDJ30_gp194 [Streptomyces phage BillNye]AVD99239.1 hypothetical protein SEA_BILLNYE_37 [Streptomyces phage BillNye]QBZ72323.1 hypothetical protein SEA_CIRCINUS_39 [Streptomyces phage Circinus]
MAQQIKDTNVIKTPEVVINPAFFLPPDVIDMRSGYTDIVEEDDVSVDEVYDADDPSPDTNGDNEENGLAAPENFSVVEQVVRIGPDGNAVVDVIIEFDDEGHNEYDIRVTKN